MDPNALLETLNSRTSAKFVMQLSFLILFLQFKAFYLGFEANLNVSLATSNHESVGFRVRLGHLGEHIGFFNEPERAPRSLQFTIFLNLREFPTSIILDQARGGAALNGKSCDRFSDDYCNPAFPWALRGTGGTDR